MQTLRALGRGLGFKAAALVDRVVQLGEGVAQLGAVGEELEALGHVRLILLALGQRRNRHRVIGDEGRLNQVRLDELIKAGLQTFALDRIRLDVHAARFALPARLLVAFPCVVIHAGILLDGLGHGQARPRAFHVDFLALILNLERAADLLCDVDVHLLHQIHDLLVIGIGLIQLDGGKFRVVARVHALVAEDAADLVDLVKPADNQALEVQLRLDAQIHRDIQRIVMGDEGAGIGADFDGLEHRGIDLEEALRIQKLAQRLENLAALDEGVLHLRIDDGIHIALAIAHILIAQAVPLFRQHAQGFAQQRQGRGMHGDLAGLGAEHNALHAQNIADIHRFEIGIDVLADVLAAHIRLNLALAVHHVNEGRLAHDSAAHHAARDADGLPLQRVEVAEHLGGGVGAVKAGNGIGIASLFAVFRQLGAANLLLLAVLRLFKFFCHDGFLFLFVSRLTGQSR